MFYLDVEENSYYTSKKVIRGAYNGATSDMDG